MTFHRYSVPSYTGGLPGGYDYINNAVTGTPAPFDAPRAAGPNVGTYFVGFGEDGRGNVVNRGLKALAENTDTLDNYFRRDLAVTAVTDDAVAGSAVSTITLTGPGVFLGVTGTPNTSSGILTFIEILDENDKAIFDNTPARCVVTAIAGWTGGTGDFSSGNVVCTVSPAIPVGKTYRVYYGVRSNLVALPIDALTKVRVPHTVASSTRRTVTNAATLTSSDTDVFLNAAGGAFNVTLPDPATMKQSIHLWSTELTIATHQVTLLQHASEKIKGLAASYVLDSPFAHWILTTDGTDWYID